MRKREVRSAGYDARSRRTAFEIAERVEFGRNVVFGPACRRVTVGFGSSLGDDVYVDAPEVTIGDYCKVHRGCLLYGYQPLRVGHNCWVGQDTIIDSIGGATVGNNVGIGAQSQLWSHIKFGDTLAGCRWHSSGPLVVEDDVWFVGHCIVSPVTAHRRSMALVGSVVTADMAENHVYAGVPARDVTDRLGGQFAEVTGAERQRRFAELCREFRKQEPDLEFRPVAVEDLTARAAGPAETLFCLRDRTYRPTRSEGEYRFMKFLLYDRAKFLPV